MKKNAERIIFILLFFIGLILIFFLCSSQLKAEFFNKYDVLIQDPKIQKSYDGTGELKVKTIDVSDTITVDTITANKIVSKTLNEYIKKTDSIYSDSIQTYASKIVYVDKNRNDIYTEDGTVLKPYKAIQSAIDKIAALNTSDYYCVFINPGVYTENIILEDTGLQRIKLQGVDNNVYINPATDTALICIQNNENLKSLNLENIIFNKSVDIIASANGSTAFEDVIWNNVYFTGNAVLNVQSINSITLKNCSSEQTNTFNISNVNWVLLENSNFQSQLNIENTISKNIPSWGIYNAQFHSYSTYQAGTVNYTADTLQEVVLNGCRWGWQNTTIPYSITVYAHNSYLRGDITNQGTVYLRNSQCQSIAGGNIIYQNFDYQIDNSSNKSGATVKDALDICLSKNDTLFFQVSNADIIYADTSITADTQMDVINDTSCFVIYGDSYGIDLTDFDYSYKINDNGYWVESSQLVYLDEVNNRIVFKADINEFAAGAVKFTIKRGSK